MYRITELSIQDLLSPEGYRCSCGKVHRVGVKKALVGEGVLAKLPELIRQEGKRKPFLVADKNTLKAAGEKVLGLLKEADIESTLYVFPQRDVEPNEFAVGQVAMNFDPSCDLLIGIGSGCINDICKVFNKSAKLPYIIVGTAPPWTAMPPIREL